MVYFCSELSKKLSVLFGAQYVTFAFKGATTNSHALPINVEQLRRDLCPTTHHAFSRIFSGGHIFFLLSGRLNYRYIVQICLIFLISLHPFPKTETACLKLWAFWLASSYLPDMYHVSHFICMQKMLKTQVKMFSPLQASSL